jgi:hypothetical protein
MFNLCFVVFAEVVKAQAVFFHVNNFTERCLQGFALCGVKQTFKNGTLHPLPMLHAFPGHTPETLSAGGIFGINVISNQYQHGGFPSFPQKRRIIVKITAQISCKQERLDIRHKAPLDFFLEVWMLYFFALVRLPCG